MKNLFITLCGILVFAAVGHPTLAQFKVCNASSNDQTVAVAYRLDGEWVSEGWWTIGKEDCKNVVGGDLKSRYFYYRATVGGGNFKGENYWFCTDPNAFTITGKGNCESRGHREEEFSEIDTGETGTSFELTLVDPVPATPKVQETAKTAKKADAKTSPTQQSSNVPVSGSLGEPFSVNAIFQGCESYDGQSHCAFHGNGFKWYAYGDAGTPPDVMAALRTYEVGQLISVSGDLTNYGDISAEVAVYSVQSRSTTTEADNTMMGLQGWWRSLDDRSSTMEIVGGEVYDYYDGEGVLEQYIRVDDYCPSAQGLQGPFLIMTVPENYNDPLCYLIEGWDAIVLQLAYVGGAGGGLLSFERFYP